MILTLKHLSFVLKVRESELRQVVQDIDKYYYEKIELKINKDGSPKLDGKGKQKVRIIRPSVGQLKDIQKRVLKNILNLIPLPDYAYGAVRGRDHIMNAKRHQGKKFIFTTDLKDFFPSISNRKVFSMFRSFNFSPVVSMMLTKLTTYKGDIPQGAPTSPAIANLVFVETGINLQELANESGLTFTSFIDDLTFSCPKDFKGVEQVILEHIRKDGFRISHKKTNYKTKNPIVTGLVVKNNCISLTASYKNKIQNLAGRTDAQVKGLLLYADRVKQANSQ